jgi:shikimate dehydrogenase
MPITGKTQLVGVFGYPIGHTASPAMHNAAFAHLDLDYRYLPFKVKPEDLKEAVGSIKALNIKGVNVTIPHKARVISYLEELTPEARQSGSVNTIIHREGKLIGESTDGRGFLHSLIENTGKSPLNKRIFILGAGGAARAIAMQLVREGAEQIIIANRTEEKARKLISDLKAACPGRKDFRGRAISLKEEELAEALSETEILINTTSVGMRKEDPLLINPRWLDSRLLVCDLICNPRQTPLLRLAKEREARTLNGVGMLLYQGVLSFELWTGKKAPLKVMRKALIQELSNGDE